MQNEQPETEAFNFQVQPMKLNMLKNHFICLRYEKERWKNRWTQHAEQYIGDILGGVNNQDDKRIIIHKNLFQIIQHLHDKDTIRETSL